MKISVCGTGYVGLSIAVLLAQHHEVVAFDVSAERVAQVNARRAPIRDDGIEAFLRDRPLKLRATLDREDAYRGATCVIVATPTNYDERTGQFDTQTVQAAVRDVLRIEPGATIVIKSTVPVGFTEGLRQTLQQEGHRPSLMFSPEFLREGSALHDNLHPTRIIVGERSDAARQFADLLRQASLRPDAPVLLTGSAEAEAIKLFANTYLAMRVAFFNELDTFAARRGLDPRQLIEGVGLDPRIGTHYNNPSFGYGGYCLPKDTRQLLANYHEVPQSLMAAVVESNAVRARFIADEVLRRGPRVVGVHRLVMKSGSDNWRESSVQKVMQHLRSQGVALIVHEPGLDAPAFDGWPVVNDLAVFKARADIILANRLAAELADVGDKVYTRDVFGGDA